MTGTAAADFGAGTRVTLHGAEELELTEDQVDAELAKRSLADFVRLAWPIVEPDEPLRWNWHIDALCELLEDVSAGKLKRVLINVPPGTMKSLLVSVFWPAWEWAQRPQLRYLTASYSSELTVRDNLRVRDVITSEWYRRHFSAQLRDDRNIKIKFETTASGWRIASSVGGRATGEHPDRIIIDDPLSDKQSRSALFREACRQWFDRTISTRGKARGAAIIVIMQRLHTEDLAAHLIAKQNFEHVLLPMRFEPDGVKPDICACHSGRPDTRDIRTDAGELLWPELFSLESIEELELDLGPYGTAGQLQQRPAPEGGGLFQRSWFEIVDASPADGDRCRGWDTAATELGGDFSVGCRLSITGDEVFVEDLTFGQWNPDQLDSNMKATAELDGKAVIIREEREGGASGKAVITARRKLLRGYDYDEWAIGGDKVVRAGPFRSQCAGKKVKLVRAPWNEIFLQILAAFPVGTYDDHVDAASCSYNALIDWLEHRPRKIDPIAW
jgi:predicted phage terminase large subunit-like protein